MALLSKLPRNGNLTHGTRVLAGDLKIYVCQKESKLPEERKFRTDSTNILIRNLKFKGEKHKEKKDKRFLFCNAVVTEVPSVKKRKGGDGKEASNSDEVKERDLRGMTVDRLRAFLRGKGAPISGRKEELLARARALLRRN